ncbi:MAG: hypothetical protein AAGA56_10820 [Myxococcota bacterium]
MASAAPATPIARPTIDKASTNTKGYAYIFEDDILNAGNEAALAPLIRVRPGPVRRMLIRPRVHFVREMTNSADAI